MHEFVWKQLIGTAFVVLSYIVSQISETAEGIINKGFDAGLSIGLLIIGLIILGIYHWKYQQYSRQVIKNLVKDKDKKAEDVHLLALQQIELSKDQIQTNKDIREALRWLTKSVDQNNR